LKNPFVIATNNAGVFFGYSRRWQAKMKFTRTCTDGFSVCTSANDYDVDAKKCEPSSATRRFVAL
jgi:hypothetical protein